MSFIYVYPVLAHLLRMSDKSGWVAGQPKILMFGAIGSAMTPLSKTLSKSHSNQHPGNSSVLLGSVWIFLSLHFFFLYGRDYKWLWHLQQFQQHLDVRNPLSLTSTFLAYLLIFFFSLAQRWKFWEQILRYAQPIWSLQTVIYTFYCSPGDA